GQARIRARETLCLNQLRQIGLAYLAYEVDATRIPLHTMEYQVANGRPQMVWGNEISTNVVSGLLAWDNRPVIGPYMDTVDNFNCPLAPARIDLAGYAASSRIYTS